MLPVAAAVGTETGASVPFEGLIVTAGKPGRLSVSAAPQNSTDEIEVAGAIDVETPTERALIAGLVGRW